MLIAYHIRYAYPMGNPDVRVGHDMQFAHQIRTFDLHIRLYVFDLHWQYAYPVCMSDMPVWLWARLAQKCSWPRTGTAWSGKICVSVGQVGSRDSLFRAAVGCRGVLLAGRCHSDYIFQARMGFFFR